MPHEPGAIANKALYDWLETKADPGTRQALDQVVPLLERAARTSLPHVNSIVKWEGSFARGTEIAGSDGDFVLVMTSRDGDRRHKVSRNERRRLYHEIKRVLQEANGIRVKEHAIKSNAISFTLRVRVPLEGDGQLEGQGVAWHVVSFDLVPSQTRFARSAGSNPAAVVKIKQPGVKAAAKALKILMRMASQSFPKMCGTYAEALVWEQHRQYKQTPGSHGDPDGLTLLLRVMEHFKAGQDESVQKDVMRQHVPYSYGQFMRQGQIEVWTNSSRCLLERYRSRGEPTSAADIDAWLSSIAKPAPARTPLSQLLPRMSVRDCAWVLTTSLCCFATSLWLAPHLPALQRFIAVLAGVVPLWFLAPRASKRRGGGGSGGGAGGPTKRRLGVMTRRAQAAQRYSTRGCQAAVKWRHALPLRAAGCDRCPASRALKVKLHLAPSAASTTRRRVRRRGRSTAPQQQASPQVTQHAPSQAPAQQQAPQQQAPQQQAPQQQARSQQASQQTPPLAPSQQAPPQPSAACGHVHVQPRVRRPSTAVVLPEPSMATPPSVACSSHVDCADSNARVASLGARSSCEHVVPQADAVETSHAHGAEDNMPVASLCARSSGEHATSQASTVEPWTAGSPNSCSEASDSTVTIVPKVGNGGDDGAAAVTLAGGAADQRSSSAASSSSTAVAREHPACDPTTPPPAAPLLANPSAAAERSYDEATSEGHSTRLLKDVDEVPGARADASRHKSQEGRSLPPSRGPLHLPLHEALAQPAPAPTGPPSTGPSDDLCTASPQRTTAAALGTPSGGQHTGVAAASSPGANQHGPAAPRFVTPSARPVAAAVQACDPPVALPLFDAYVQPLVQDAATPEYRPGPDRVTDTRWAEWRHPVNPEHLRQFDADNRKLNVTKANLLAKLGC